MSKLISHGGPPAFGDDATAHAYEQRVARARDELRHPVVVSLGCSVTFEGERRGSTVVLRELAPVPEGWLSGGEIARLAIMRVLLIADPSRLRAARDEVARFRVAPRTALTVCPPGEGPRIAGPGERIEPSFVQGGLAQVRYLVERGLVEDFGPPPPEAA